jgi:DNA-binding NarL/FixJ family response regulator
MQTVFAMESTAKTAPFTNDSAVPISIVASSSALRARIERLARRAGARVFGGSPKFEVLLLAIDSATPLPTSVSALNLLAPAPAYVCVLWCGSAPAPSVISQLLRAGVAGIVPIGIEGPKFRAALTAIRAGLQVVDPAFMREQKESEHTNSSAEELTDREQEVLAMMGEGLSNKEISSRMAISTHTVKFHISSILGKLGAASRTEAVSIGVKTGRLTI